MSRSGLRFSVPPTGANPIDRAHLGRATLGDGVLADEVLGLFLKQVAGFEATVRSQPQDALALAHKLKGSARGIGAWPVADAAETFEAALSAKSDHGPALAALLAEIATVQSAVIDHLRRT